MRDAPHKILQVLATGPGLTFQDFGRPGWRRFGVPGGGAMDRHAAECANRLLDNPANATVIEMVGAGAKFRVLEDVWVAITGADLDCSLPMNRTERLREGGFLTVTGCRAGLWSYLAVEGGFAVERIFGSASFYARGAIGHEIKRDQFLSREDVSTGWGSNLSGRLLPWRDLRRFPNPAQVRIWPGPQWELFSAADQNRLVETVWRISVRSDRVGYRLEGPPLASLPEMISEPVRVGSIQVPASGELIVMMPDGPTVGGYPKIAIIDDEDLGILAQSPPRGEVVFNVLDVSLNHI